MTNDTSIDQSDFTKNVEGMEDVKQCWKNILFTIPGSVPLMPTFGCDLFKYIDNPNSDSFGRVRNIIIAALEKWEPRTKINKCTRTINGDQVFIDVIGTYQGKPIESRFNISESDNRYVYVTTPTNPILDISGINSNSSSVKDVEEYQYSATGGESFIEIPEGKIVQIIREIKPMQKTEYTYNAENRRITFNNVLNEGELISVIIKTT